MPRPPTPDFAMLPVNREAQLRPVAVRVLDEPVPARATGPTYGDGTVTVDVLVVAAARGALCVQQTAPGWPAWRAWLPTGGVDRVTPPAAPARPAGSSVETP
ncbi:hypothetical protein [Luteimicrobium subarcticum]|uniref:Uncharacterized protein n=1 Tax=Luteimicrobium subarcticum TaxID=620910 RepID=A0A2M8W3K7_9MICO|nr:hypothetical protein [Luteimicrobium subarcticum]PJI85505.1 hypothetical protein CLV34_3019 [Luteimicrobium subarcticum]